GAATLTRSMHEERRSRYQQAEAAECNATEEPATPSRKQRNRAQNDRNLQQRFAEIETRCLFLGVLHVALETFRLLLRLCEVIGPFGDVRLVFSRLRCGRLGVD